MITEDYVSFETAKLLKEMGFDCACKVWYSEYTSQFGGKKYTSIEFDDHNKFNENYKFICSAPTLQMAMKWLRENYGFHIAVCPHSFEKLSDKAQSYIFKYWFNGEYHSPYQEKRPDYYKLCAKTWESYEEACEAAIHHCLENLI